MRNAHESPVASAHGSAEMIGLEAGDLVRPIEETSIDDRDDVRRPCGGEQKAGQGSAVAAPGTIPGISPGSVHGAPDRDSGQPTGSGAPWNEGALAGRRTQNLAHRHDPLDDRMFRVCEGSRSLVCVVCRGDGEAAPAMQDTARNCRARCRSSWNTCRFVASNSS